MTRPATSSDLDRFAELVSVPLATFTPIFQRAQHMRDTMVDVAEVSPGAKDDRAHIRDSFAYARNHAFLGQLLVAGLEENIAGVPGTADAVAFAELAEEIAGIRSERARGLAIDPDDRERFEMEARNEEGFDSDPVRLSAQVLAAMRSVCKIRDTKNNRVGTGVLIAPHLVATAAHVVAKLLDDNGEALPGSAAQLSIQMDAVANLPGADVREIPVAEHWRVDCSLWPPAMLPEDAGGEGRLPTEDELQNHDDLIVIRLEEAPGFLRGWLELAEPGQQFDEKRRGLIFHHHPGGGDQKVSVGRYCGTYGPRFKHDCSSLKGSSGGPVVNIAARIAGVHHGTVKNGAGSMNLGGGGARLGVWRSERPDDYAAPQALNPVWEIRKTGKVGTGQPVVGFERLQRRIWDMELGRKTTALFVRGGNLAGRLVFDIIEAMLPADRALITRFDRVLLNDIIQALSAEAASESQTAIAITEIARRIGHTGAAVADRQSTDPIEARATAPTIAQAFATLPTERTLWILVNIGDLSVPTPLSEALGYLYRACLRLEGDRGRLLVVGSDAQIRDKIKALVEDVFMEDIPDEILTPPVAADVERYFLRWAREVGDPTYQLPEVAKLNANACIRMVTAKDGRDFYSDLEESISILKP